MKKNGRSTQAHVKSHPKFVAAPLRRPEPPRPPPAPSIVGRESPPGFCELEKGAIRRFSTAVGETNPIHFDEAAARAAGYASLVAPPAFLAALRPGTDLIAELTNGKQVLHAEQQFELARPLLAGETVTVYGRVADVSSRTLPSGVAETVIVEHEGSDGAGATVFRSRATLVLRTSQRPATTPESSS